MGKHLVLAGGGHAHLMTLERLDEFVRRGHRVTVIGPAAYHYYSGMGPGMLAGVYTPEEIRFAIRRVTEKKGGTFLCDAVETIDPRGKTVRLTSGGQIAYDVLSCNLGSHVPRDLVTRDEGGVYPVKPIEQLLEARQRLLDIGVRRPAGVVVAGGGPAAAEIAGNVHHLALTSGINLPAITVCAGRSFLGRFPESVRSRVYRSLTGRGIVIDESGFVTAIQTGAVTLESGRTITADVIFVAPGVKPSPVAVASGLPGGPDGGLLVNQYLQSPTHPEIFGGGDCIYFEPRPLDKVGVYAVRQNPLLLHNLLAALEGGPLRPFRPQDGYLLILNLGDYRGVLKKGWLTFEGRAAFLLKDYIDRRFMRRFQAME
ncbi:MAG: FAD-dependent oxidoreductase [Thermodesulfobacteriota bacterium]